MLCIPRVLVDLYLINKRVAYGVYISAIFQPFCGTSIQCVYRTAFCERCKCCMHTRCKLWTHDTHCFTTRHVPKHLPRPCMCTTGIIKHRHMLQSHNSRHKRLKDKAPTKVLASPWPCIAGTIQINNNNNYHRHCNPRSL